MIFEFLFFRSLSTDGRRVELSASLESRSASLILRQPPLTSLSLLHLIYSLQPPSLPGHE